MSEFSDSEIAFYSKHFALDFWDKEHQNRLKKSKVLVIGCGGLGCPLLMQLALAGVGEITIVDYDIISLSNLQRQFLFKLIDIGKPKAEIAQRELLLLNPYISIKYFLEKSTLFTLEKQVVNFDLIVDCTDSLESKYFTNDSCVYFQRPYLYGAVSTQLGYAALFNKSIFHPNLRTFFPYPHFDSQIDCAENGAFLPLTSMIGGFMAQLAIALLAEIDSSENHFGKLFLYDVNTMNLKSLKANHSNEIYLETLNCYKNHFSNEQLSEIEIQAFTLDEWIQNGNENIVLFDIRSQKEHLFANIGGENIIINDFITNFKAKSDKKYIFYCQHGLKSLKLVKELKLAFPFAKIYSLAGGIHEWSIKIDSKIPIY